MMSIFLIFLLGTTHAMFILPSSNKDLNIPPLSDKYSTTRAPSLQSTTRWLDMFVMVSKVRIDLGLLFYLFKLFIYFQGLLVRHHRLC